MTVRNDITDYIDTFIATMTVVGGYNFNYDNVNEHDPSARTYPSVMTAYTDSVGETTQMSNKYTSVLTAVFKVTVDNSADVDLLLSKVEDDFRKMFNDEYDNMRLLGLLPGLKNSGATKTYNLNKLRPGTISIPWDLPYRVSMDDPSST